ncbi:hypothetical protein KBY93_06795 [Synechococcus sp. J7-Johnson]|uniref:hypothetical protein n=1 Tax=Synechococcus sp. J7-Johnson TaxID=2823737 RepID=UPI0020CCAA78|nr:hypothetical protein [Synechococcus sp. J7-Johnson]MCP9840343.1 hypothetical protein [Synechococcus sp. J7-Johnson]
MLIYAAISGHGYGHGSRSGAILLALAQRQPGWRLVLSTSLPSAFLRTVLGAVPFEQRPCSWDVGVVQADALGADPAATLAALNDLERRLPDQIAEEARWLNAQAGPVLLLGDVPPALARLAQAGGWPLIWVGNFGWDAIYDPMGGSFLVWAERCRALYRMGQGLIHCPFSMAMDWGLPEIRVGLTVAPPRERTEALRQKLELPERSSCVLVSFGGLGFELGEKPFHRWPELTFVGTDPSAAGAPNVRLLPQGVRLLEFMPLVERLITKPGYSSFCEALAHDVGIHLVHREGFAEAPVLEEALRRHGRHRLLSQEQLRSGEWQLDQPLHPASVGPLALDGAQQAAAWLEQQALAYS